MSVLRGERPPVLIVGAGPTGLVLACQLLRRGVACRVIDKADGPLPVSRAIGLSPRSLEILDECGAAERLLQRGIPTPVASFYSRGRCIGQLTSSAQTGTRFPFMLAIPQWETEAVLAERVVELGGAIDRSTALTSLCEERELVIGTVSGPRGEESVEASWVVGADGAHSRVRKELGVGFPGRATAVVFVIVDARVENGPGAGDGRYYFSPQGLLVIVPLPDGSHRLAATVEDERGGQELDLSAVQRLVDERVGARHIGLQELRDAGWGAAQVRVHTRIAERFRSGRVFLAGDAAHIYSPVGGQGLNGGVQDAHNLAWKLALVDCERASAALLSSFESERSTAAQMALKASSRQTRLATIRRPLGIALRDALMGRAARSGLLDRRMAPQIAQFDIDYASSPIVSREARRGVAGRRVPDTALTGPSGTPSTVHGLLGEGVLVVLALSRDPQQVPSLSTLRSAIEERYGGLVSMHVLVRDQPASAFVEQPIVDDDGALHGYLGRPEALCVLRPDGYIAWIGDIDDHAGALRSISAMLVVGATEQRMQRSFSSSVEVSANGDDSRLSGAVARRRSI